jgi:hypothetical protein
MSPGPSGSTARSLAGSRRWPPPRRVHAGRTLSPQARGRHQSSGSLLSSAGAMPALSHLTEQALRWAGHDRAQRWVESGHGCGTADAGPVVLRAQSGWQLRALATGEGLDRVSGCDAPVAGAHGGDPYPGGPSQVVGRSAVRAADIRLRFRGESLGGEPAPAVAAMVAAYEAIEPGARSCSGSPPVVRLPVVPGEGFDWPVEPVAGRASDHGAFEGPIAGAHGVPAADLGGKPASDNDANLRPSWASHWRVPSSPGGRLGAREWLTMSGLHS